MTDTYVEAVSKVVNIFKSRYRLNMAEADDLESTIVVHLTTINQNPAVAPLLDEPRYLRTVVNNQARNFLWRLAWERKHFKPVPECNEFDGVESNVVGRIWVKEMMEALSDEQKQVITLYYGLDGAEPITEYRAIAEKTGISRGRAKRLHESALAILKRMMN